MPLHGLLERQSLQQAWTAPDAFATTLLLLLIDTYGTTALEWEGTTIRMEVESDFNVDLPQGNFDRLMVARDLMTTDNFYQSLPDFIQWCNILSGDTYDPRVWDPADAQELAWGISEALIIETPDEAEPFSQEILAYIGSILDQEGIINAPDILRVALRSLDRNEQVRGEFADDPIMFSAIYDLDADKTGHINMYIREQVARLSRQLEGLSLRTGTTKGVVQRMLQTLS